MRDGNRMWNENLDGELQYSAVCGYMNGIPGDWSRFELLERMENMGPVVAFHARMGTIDKQGRRRRPPHMYEGIG